MLSRLTSLLPCAAMSSRRGPGRRDVYVTTQLHLGEIPLLSRRHSPAVSDADEQPRPRGDGVARGQHLQPQQQQQQQRQLHVVDTADHQRPSLDLAGTASACSWLSIYDDQQSPVNAAPDTDDTHE